MPLVASERAVAGVAARASVLRELLLAYAADDSGFGEGGGRGGSGGGRFLGDLDVPLHTRRAVAARALLACSLAGALGRFGRGFRRAVRPGPGAFSKLESEAVCAGRRQ